jgi:hypothetical protein
MATLQGKGSVSIHLYSDVNTAVGTVCLYMQTVVFTVTMNNKKCITSLLHHYFQSDNFLVLQIYIEARENC